MSPGARSASAMSRTTRARPSTVPTETGKPNQRSPRALVAVELPSMWTSFASYERAVACAAVAASGVGLGLSRAQAGGADQADRSSAEDDVDLARGTHGAAAPAITGARCSARAG